MASAKQLKAARDEAIARLHMSGEQSPSEEDIAEVMADVLSDWGAESALDREMYGEPDEAESVQSCDTWGTGEGRFHGRM